MVFKYGCFALEAPLTYIGYAIIASGRKSSIVGV